jgi:hypothetical protein
MSEQNRRRKAKEEIVRDDLQVRKTIRHMIWSRFRLRCIATGAVECPPENSEWIQMAQWLFQEANSSELRAVAKAIKKFEMPKPGDLDSRLAKESYLEVRAARARMRDKRPTLAEVRFQVLRNCIKHRVAFGEGQEFKRAIEGLSYKGMCYNLIDRTLRKKLDSLNCPLRPNKRGRPAGS